MKPADLAALPIRWGAAARGARLFHPNGVLAIGSMGRRADAGVGLPFVSGDVLARISKGVGTAGGMPDVVGLAVRMEPRDGEQRPWDVLLASALGAGRGWTKTLPCPARSLNRATLTTLQPLKYRSDAWWIRGRLAPQAQDLGMSLDRFSEQIDRVGLVFELDQARHGQPFTPLARLTVTATKSEKDDPGIGFDPTLNTPADVRPGPAWLANFRAAAYRQSREGRR